MQMRLKIFLRLLSFRKLLVFKVARVKVLTNIMSDWKMIDDINDDSFVF